MTSVGAVAAVLIIAAGAPGTATTNRASTGGSIPIPTPTTTTTPTIPEIPLDAALAALDAENLSLAQARARAEEAWGTADQSRAALLPSLSAVGSYTRNSDAAGISVGPPLVPVTRSVVIQPLESFSATGVLRLPLLVPSAWLDMRAARSGARAAEASAESARLQIRAGFAQAAHGARAAEEVVVASERAVESAGAHARSAERRVAAGTAPPLESLKARTELVRREGDLAHARAELARARLALGVLLGRDAPVRIAVPEDEAVPAQADRDRLAAEALERRPELRAQRARIDAAEAQVRATWLRLAPQLSASGSAFAADVAYPTGEKDGWRATVDLSWSILDGGLREGRRRQARAQLAGARSESEAQRLAVLQEVADGSRDVEVAGERLRLARTQRELASDAAESARRSFEAGVASSLDVIDANDRLYAADVGLAEARARLAQARIALDRALGR